MSDKPTPVVKSVPRDFSRVTDWIFDLDNTLYAHEARVWPQVDERITLFLSHHFGIDGISARALQKHLYHRYGTTLKGLTEEEGIDPSTFLDFVHDIDLSELHPDDALRQAIADLPGRRFIMTNGTVRHAQNVAGKLGLIDLFDDVFDIVAAGMTPKPEPVAYDTFLARHGIDSVNAAMFEDIARNLVVPHKLGMTTVLVLPRTPDPFREAHEQMAVAEPHIDHVTTDLAGFLETMRKGGGR